MLEKSTYLTNCLTFCKKGYTIVDPACSVNETAGLILDAQGNQMAMYEHVVDSSEVKYYLKERTIYGSALLGTANDTVNLFDPQLLQSYGVTGNRYYQLTDHRNNVYTVINDLVIPLDGDSDEEVDGYQVGIVSITDYSPFNVELDGRTIHNGQYRYSVQGQEHHDEILGDGNYINYKYRGYDPRVGRLDWMIDPLAKDYPWNSPYAFSENRVMDCIELEGLEKLELSLIGMYQSKGSKLTISIVATYDLNEQLLQVTIVVGDNSETPNIAVQFQYNVYNKKYDVKFASGVVVPKEYAKSSDFSTYGMGKLLTEALDAIGLFESIANGITEMPEYKKELDKLGISETFIEGTLRGFSDMIEKAKSKGSIEYGIESFDSPDQVKRVQKSGGYDNVEYEGGAVVGIQNTKPLKIKIGDESISVEKVKVKYTNQTKKKR